MLPRMPCGKVLMSQASAGSTAQRGCVGEPCRAETSGWVPALLQACAIALHGTHRCPMPLPAPQARDIAAQAALLRQNAPPLIADRCCYAAPPEEQELGRPLDRHGHVLLPCTSVKGRTDTQSECPATKINDIWKHKGVWSPWKS